VIAARDDRASAPPVAVLSHHAWQGAYAADPSLSVAAASLAGCAFFAALIPASRAATIPPMAALRSDSGPKPLQWPCRHDDRHNGPRLQRSSR
jgi:hypothetical protein